jgi:quercetin dioxygenase-like cupin family protein
VTIGGKETVLGPLDSCHIPPGEERAIVNKTNRVATMLVVMPAPEK